MIKINHWVRLKMWTTIKPAPADLFVGSWLSSKDDGNSTIHAYYFMFFGCNIGKLD